MVTSSFTSSFTVAGRRIGPQAPCFVIAEAGVNHNGDLNRALALIDAAAEAGADAVKFQSFQAAHLVTAAAPKAGYQKRSTDQNESQFDMLRRLELDEAAHRRLVEHCHKRGLLFMSTPFDQPSADLLQRLGVAVYKLPSGEITNHPFLAYVAGKQTPLIVSTGMCSLGEVEAAVETLEAAGCRQFALLHCVSSYPADPADVNLAALDTLQAAFGYPVGYSDHTLGLEVALAAVARGACVLEKHFTLDRGLPGPDHAASLEPDELRALVRGIRNVELALGDGRKRPAGAERDTAAVARKSLVAAVDLPAGSVLSADKIAIKRPGTGLPPAMRPHFLDRVVRVHVPAGTLLDLGMLE